MEWVEELTRGLAKVGEELEKIRRIMEGSKGRASTSGEVEERQECEEGEGIVGRKEGEECGSEGWLEELAIEAEEREREEKREKRTVSERRAEKGEGEGKVDELGERRGEGGEEGKKGGRKDQGEGVGERMRRWIEDMARKRVVAEYGVERREKGRERSVEEEEEETSELGKGRGGEGQDIVRRREEEVRRKREERERVREEKERKEKEEEGERREARKRNLIWRGIEGRDAEERREFVESLARRVLGRRIGVKEVQERKGEGGRVVLLVEVEDERDRVEILEKSWEIRRKWEVGVDEDLTMEERKARWRIVTKAREEKAKGREVRITNRRIWIENREWRWNEGREEWEEE
ncbi:uncharacterized protein [Temnothorax longispinosus]|uniref:uncharacterized protein n=1 Tax=Temnothorax longispinosus TaxID=300112 RepID=UPI003A999518